MGPGWLVTFVQTVKRRSRSFDRLVRTVDFEESPIASTPLLLLQSRREKLAPFRRPATKASR